MSTISSRIWITNPAVVIILYISIIVAMFAIGAFYYIDTLRVRVATETARSFDASLVTIQDYYSLEIVPRARAAGVELSHRYDRHTDVIPFPATFTMDVGNRFGETVPGLYASLYSDTPFPWRQNRTLDQFESVSLEILQENPSRPYIQIARQDGQRVVRYASAVILKQSCVDCHNLPKYRFGQTWKVGDFRGARQVSVPLPESVEVDQEFYYLTGVFMFVAALIGGAIVFPVVVRLNRSLAEASTLAEQLEYRNRELEEKSQAKDEFLASMSHELRTPLNAILGFSDMIRQSILGPIGNDRYREYADDIHKGGTHLRSMIDDLLDLSRIEAGTMTLHEAELDLHELWRDVEILTSGMAENAGMSISVEFEVGLPGLLGDERAMKQILVNLVANSVIHSNGTNIEVCLLTEAESIALSVSDDGEGIAPENIDRLTDRFYRVDQSHRSSKGGLGIGLSLVDALSELHGASLVIENRKEGGARFSVTFPASRTRYPAS